MEFHSLLAKEAFNDANAAMTYWSPPPEIALPEMGGECLILIHPLKRNLSVTHVLQIVQRSMKQQANTVRGYQRFLQQMGEVATRYLTRNRDEY
jgi:hypothetical protein